MFCKTNGPKFGDELISYEQVDKDVLFCFLNLSMTSTATVKFKERMTYEKLSDAVTIFEEAFAILIFENNFDRWVYMAEREKRKTRHVSSIEQDETTTSDTCTDEDSRVSGECSQEDKVPDVLYQIRVRQRKDKIDTAGKWTKEGMDRLNKLITLVQEGRNSNTREQFEIGLQEQYIKYADSNIELQNKNKRKRELEEMASMSNKSVTVKNVLNLVAL